MASVEKSYLKPLQSTQLNLTNLHNNKLFCIWLPIDIDLIFILKFLRWLCTWNSLLLLKGKMVRLSNNEHLPHTLGTQWWIEHLMDASCAVAYLYRPVLQGRCGSLIVRAHTWAMLATQYKQSCQFCSPLPHLPIAKLKNMQGSSDNKAIVNNSNKRSFNKNGCMVAHFPLSWSSHQIVHT